MEQLPYQPECIKSLEDIFPKSIRFWRIKDETFFSELKQGQNREVFKRRFGLSFVACIGGVFRSSYIARYLNECEIELASNKCLSGYPITRLAEEIVGGETGKDGYIQPKGFQKPIQTIFLGLNIGISEIQDDTTISLIAAIIKLQSKNTQVPIKLDIVVVDGGESNSGTLYRKYTDEIDETPAPPAFPEV